jgi:hypothetical protein
VRSGHYLVNWKRVQLPKRLGGLGVLDLGRFNKAMRLRWQWLKWKNQSKHWSKMPLAQSNTEIKLFRVCTPITVGNGSNTKFWHE